MEKFIAVYRVLPSMYGMSRALLLQSPSTKAVWGGLVVKSVDSPPDGKQEFELS